MPGWHQNPGPPKQTKEKGSSAKGGSRNPVGKAQRADPGGKGYPDSDSDLKTNGRSLAKNTPLLSEFTRYGGWGIASKRWAKMLHNRPLSRGVDYFANKLK